MDFQPVLRESRKKIKPETAAGHGFRTMGFAMCKFFQEASPLFYLPVSLCLMLILFNCPYRFSIAGILYRDSKF
jgi:hypothetical protein